MKYEVERGIAPEPEAIGSDAFDTFREGDSVWFMASDEAGEMARNFTTWTELNGKPLHATARPVSFTDPKGMGWRVFIMALRDGEMRPLGRLDFAAIWMARCLHAGSSMCRTNAAFERFGRWMGTADPGSITKFTQTLRERGVALKRRSDGWYLTDIEIVDGEQLPQVIGYNRDFEAHGNEPADETLAPIEPEGEDEPTKKCVSCYAPTPMDILDGDGLCLDCLS